MKAASFVGKTGARMVMGGRTDGDRVDDVRVRHVRQVGHGAWACGRSRLKEARNVILAVKENFRRQDVKINGRCGHWSETA